MDISLHADTNNTTEPWVYTSHADPSYGKPSHTESYFLCQDVDIAELFSGSATLAKEFYYEGKEVIACDYIYTEQGI